MFNAVFCGFYKTAMNQKDTSVSLMIILIEAFI